MFDYVLMDCLDEGVIRHRLNENRAVIVARRCSDINLERQTSILLQHSVMDILNRLEPRHLGIVNVMGFIIEDGKFLDLADDFPQVCAGVRRFSHRPWAERRKEIVAQVLVF